MFFNRVKRFLRQFFHPGTWILFSLLAVGAAILFPLSAPALMIFAAVAIGVAAVTFVPYVVSFLNNETPISFFFPRSHRFDVHAAHEGWGREHYIQLAIMTIGVAAFIAALVLTIGFFTGGAGFAFMAPVFAALAAPFAAAGASAGCVSLSLSALAGTVLVLGVLNLTNTLKRFTGWLDSFRYDHAATTTKGQCSDNNGFNDDSIPVWKEKRGKVAEEEIGDSNIKYVAAVFQGMWATACNDFASPDADRLEQKPSYVHIC
jgi:hypothetical protein